jgi:L-ribulokinase
VRRLVAAGGLPERNKLLMQIYADVTDREIAVIRSPQAPAVGSAMHAAVAAGVEAGGYPDIATAARHMGGLREDKYVPIPEHARAYERLYSEYKTLYDYFGRGENEVMKRLRALRREASAPLERDEEADLQSNALPDATEQQAFSG